jgi:xanthine dehydrogenase accessory factor
LKKADIEKFPDETIVGIKGAGDIATGVAVRLKRSGFSKIFMMEVASPLAVRRTVSFCEAVHVGRAVVEGITAVRASSQEAIGDAWESGQIPVIVDPCWTFVSSIKPRVLVDAILAKQNLGTTLEDAPLVIGLGPGFTATGDVHAVVETMRGHDLGRVIYKGSAQPNTGVPGEIGGHTKERVYHAPTTGSFHSDHEIGDRVEAGDVIGDVDGMAVAAKIDGLLRGLIRQGTVVRKGVKIGDIDPRGRAAHCFTVSDKARAIGGGVLEAIVGANIWK